MRERMSASLCVAAVLMVKVCHESHSYREPANPIAVVRRRGSAKRELITGDFRDPEVTVRLEFRKRIRRLCKVIAAKHGTVAVLGNHDTVEDVPFLERLGIRMLLNEAMAIERKGSRIWIVGVDDPHFFGTHDLQKALKDTDKSELHLLLAHSPDLADEAANAGVDIYLCGHSHGGQICLPDRTPIFANMRARREFASGGWRAGGMLGYTSRGVGTSGLPIRAYCRPELTLHFLDRLRSSGSPDRRLTNCTGSLRRE